jgi:hypothetical protein
MRADARRSSTPGWQRLRSAPLLAFDTETDSLDPMQARWSA